jgi:hypothetical protein
MCAVVGSYSSYLSGDESKDRSKPEDKIIHRKTKKDFTDIGYTESSKENFLKELSDIGVLKKELFYWQILFSYCIKKDFQKFQGMSTNRSIFAQYSISQSIRFYAGLLLSVPR